MKLDWQHVVLAVVGMGCVTAVVLLGHGNTLVQVFAGLGGVAGVASLIKASPLRKEASDLNSAGKEPHDAN